MQLNAIRDVFLQYFNKLDHSIVPSSSLVPLNDPSLLFTNAGMVQFKDNFLGLAEPINKRVASVQQCLRAGGKHNDLENVGYTNRHHTFFEMLGNFSFGDYFKEEAIHFAWNFLTKELQLPADKLWITVYQDDNEAADIWLKDIKISPQQFSRCGVADNFWSMGEVGPCGPCSEIYYDYGPKIAGGPPGSNIDGERYVEIWNLVFMQYNRDKDGRDILLPKPSVDTGMGLERIASVLQGVTSNYATDLFSYLIEAISAIVGNNKATTSLRVLADHIRATSFLISAGVLPSNEGRGYVLRRIMRRAIRHGYKLGLKEPFFYKILPALVNAMGQFYPELLTKQDFIKQVILKEEEQFFKTIDIGMRLLENHLKTITSKIIAGDVVFKLYDTYGFPVDLTNDIAREHGLTLDMPGFEQLMELQRQRARNASNFISGSIVNLIDSKSEFCGYEKLHTKTTIAQILTVAKQDALLLAETPFYAESGGQIGDVGEIIGALGKFIVKDTQKQGANIIHLGTIEGSLKVGETVEAKVDRRTRQAVARNHSATHLLHAALQEILGAHVEQKGSLVEASRLRLDFTNLQPVTKEQLLAIETRVNKEILANTPIGTDIMDLTAAKALGAKALFNEKYQDTVRVLSMGENKFSIELCGGTHCSNTGDIGLFKIIEETGIASGIRRITALTGEAAFNWLQQQLTILEQVSQQLKTTPKEVPARVNQLQATIKSQEQNISSLQQMLAIQLTTKLQAQAQQLNGMKLIAAEIGPEVTANTLVDNIVSNPNSVAIIATRKHDKAEIVVGVSTDLMNKISAKEILSAVMKMLNGKGGGKACKAQGVGHAMQLTAALDSVPTIVEQLVTSMQ